MGELLKLLGIPGTVIALLGLMGWTALGAIKVWRELHDGRRAAAPERIEPPDLAPLEQHIDLTLTEHFDQLRRDLERKIEIEATNSLKATENRLLLMAMDLEALVTGRPKKRRRR